MMDKIKFPPFTPIFDFLPEEYSLAEKVVFGIVYRYAQMREGWCLFPQGTIANLLGIHRSTVNAAIVKLKKDNLILTLPTTYKGKARELYKPNIKLVLSMQIEQVTSEEIPFDLGYSASDEVDDDVENSDSIELGVENSDSLVSQIPTAAKGDGVANSDTYKHKDNNKNPVLEKQTRAPVRKKGDVLDGMMAFAATGEEILRTKTEVEECFEAFETKTKEFSRTKEVERAARWLLAKTKETGLSVEEFAQWIYDDEKRYNAVQTYWTPFNLPDKIQGAWNLFAREGDRPLTQAEINRANQVT